MIDEDLYRRCLKAVALEENRRMWRAFEKWNTLRASYEQNGRSSWEKTEIVDRPMMGL